MGKRRAKRAREENTDELEETARASGSAAASVEAAAAAHAEPEQPGSSSAPLHPSAICIPAWLRRRRRRARAPAAAAQVGPDGPPSPLELLPDELLKRIIGFLGLRETYARGLPLVCSRLADVLASIEWPALELQSKALGFRHFTDMEEQELVSWATRIRAGVLRLAPGASLVIDLWRQPSALFLNNSVHFSLWNFMPSSPLLSSCLSQYTSLREVVVRHGDVAPGQNVVTTRPAAATRQAYVNAILKALAPCAASLESLSIGLQIHRVGASERFCPRAPPPTAAGRRARAPAEGASRKEFVAALRRLSGLRRLDLADAVGFSAKLLGEIGPAFPRLAALRASFRDSEAPESYDAARAAAEGLAASVLELYPGLEEVRILGSRNLHWSPSALGSLFRLRGLRTLELNGKVNGLPAPHPTLERLELHEDAADTWWSFASDLLVQLQSYAALRSLSVRSNPLYSSVGSVAQLRELSLSAPHTTFSSAGYERFAPPAHWWPELLRLRSLESLRLALSGPHQPLLATLGGLGGVLGRLAGLRSLSLSVFVSDRWPHSGPDPLEAPLSVALGAVLNDAADLLIEYVRDLCSPAAEEVAALARCTRLRRAVLELSGSFNSPRADADIAGLAVLAPLRALAPGGPAELLLLAPRHTGARAMEQMWAASGLDGSRWRFRS